VSASSTADGRAYIPPLRLHVLTRVYDPIVRVTTRERAVKDALVGDLGLRPGDRLLDVGCGTGTLLGMLAARCTGVTLTGVDADAGAVEIAQHKVGPAVTLVEGDARDLPFAPGSFDRVVSSLLFHHLTRDDKRAALAAIRRVLAPGGTFHLADFGAAQDAWMRVAYLGVQILDGFTTTGDNVRGELAPLFRDAGFQDVDETLALRSPLGTIRIHRGRK